ncbi:PEP-CTERM sorting domain-containing protein [Pseudoduganella danionis]
MKISTLVNCALVMLSLAGGAQVQAAQAEKANIAPATIVLAHCDHHAAQPCGLDNDGNNTAGKNSEPEALPANDPKRAQEVEPVAQIPEPQTFVMLMLGLVVLGFASRRGDASEKFTD